MAQHPQYEEVKDTLEFLIKNGLTLKSVDDGGEEHITDNIDEVIDHVTGVDCSTVCLKLEDGKIGYLSIVLGNEPGVLINDYAGHYEACRLIDPVIDFLEEKYA